MKKLEQKISAFVDSLDSHNSEMVGDFILLKAGEGDSSDDDKTTNREKCVNELASCKDSTNSKICTNKYSNCGNTFNGGKCTNTELTQNPITNLFSC